MVNEELERWIRNSVSDGLREIAVQESRMAQGDLHPGYMACYLRILDGVCPAEGAHRFIPVDLPNGGGTVPVSWTGRYSKELREGLFLSLVSPSYRNPRIGYVAPLPVRLMGLVFALQKAFLDVIPAQGYTLLRATRNSAFHRERITSAEGRDLDSRWEVILSVGGGERRTEKGPKMLSEALDTLERYCQHKVRQETLEHTP